MTKVSLSFNLVLIFSLLAISVVKSSRILGDLPEMTGAATTEASSSLDSKSILMNDDNLISDTVDNEPREAEASSVIKETKPVTFIDTIPIIMNVHDTNTPCMMENENLLTDNANKIILGSVKITITTDGARVTKVSDCSKEAAKEETESTGPDTKSKDTVDQSAVPRGIGGNVFFGKAMSGSSEMYNVSANDFYNQIFQTMNNDVFVVGRFAQLADTQHNRMVLAKFDKEETNTGDDSAENMPVKGNYFKY